MRTRVSVFVSCAAIGLAALTAEAQQPELVIDDFTASPYSRELRNHPTFLTEYQTGANIFGGVRQTNLTVTPAWPNVGQSTQLQIRPNGYLVLNGGYKSQFGLFLGYGYDAAGGAPGLNMNLSDNGGECPECDRFRIYFDGSDSELSYLMQVQDSDGDIAMFSGTESMAGRTVAFHLDVEFAGFEQDPAHPVDWDRIDFIFVLLQTGNVLGGHDFAVTKIVAIPKPSSN
jgi:hypothetical protein